MAEPLMQFEDITPEVAERLLANNTHNRTISPKRVREYAQQMKAGRWRTTHQGIAVDSRGVLLDGQHRLEAVKQSGVTVRMLVARNSDPEDFKVTDVMRSRTAGDVLDIARIPQARAVAATLRLLVAYDLRVERPWKDWREQLRPQDLIDEYARYPEVGEAVRQANAVRKRIGGSHTALAAALYVINRWATRQGPAVLMLTNDWREGLETGANLKAGDPRLALHSWITHSLAKVQGNAKAELLMALTLRVYYAGVRSEQLNKLSVKNPNTFTFRLPGD